MTRTKEKNMSARKAKNISPDTRRLDFIAEWGLKLNTIDASKGKERVEFIFSLDDGNEDMIVRSGETLQEATRRCVDAAIKKGTKGLN